MPDAVAGLIAYLKADAAVAAIVGARVFGGELPKGETALMPRAALVIRPSGGSNSFGGGYQEFGDRRFDLMAYGATPFAASKLWEAVHPALKQMRRNRQGTQVLHWARPAGGPLALRDGDADWPYTLSVWQVLAAEREPA